MGNHTSNFVLFVDSELSSYFDNPGLQVPVWETLETCFRLRSSMFCDFEGKSTLICEFDIHRN